jgi:hypothetical protein
MTLLDMHRRQLAAARSSAAKEQTAVAKASSELTRKSSQLSRTRGEAQRGMLVRQLESLQKKRASAETRLGRYMTEAARLERKVADEERRQARRLASAAPVVLDQVQALVAADPGPRQHDVYLCHASPDKPVARELRDALEACRLDVWFDEARLVLGESQSMQMDRGIAGSRVGVVLVTPAFLKGRKWTERELGAMFSTDRRVIPVVHGVTFDEIAAYSPFLADRAGLTLDDGVADAAQVIADALAV